MKAQGTLLEGCEENDGTIAVAFLVRTSKQIQVSPVTAVNVACTW